MTTKAPRPQKEIISTIRAILARIKKTPPATAQDLRDEHTFINALVWSAGGCVNPYHEPECDGYGPPCRNPGDNPGGES